MWPNKTWKVHFLWEDEPFYSRISTRDHHYSRKNKGGSFPNFLLYSWGKEGKCYSRTFSHFYSFFIAKGSMSLQSDVSLVSLFFLQERGRIMQPSFSFLKDDILGPFEFLYFLLGGKLLLSKVSHISPSFLDERGKMLQS